MLQSVGEKSELNGSIAKTSPTFCNEAVLRLVGAGRMGRRCSSGACCSGKEVAGDG